MESFELDLPSRITPLELGQFEHQRRPQLSGDPVSSPTK